MPWNEAQYPIGWSNLAGGASDWSYVDKIEWDGVNINSSQQSFTGLEGDKYDYKLITSINASATDNVFVMCFNSDGFSTTNYRIAQIDGYSTTTEVYVNNTYPYVTIGYTGDDPAGLLPCFAEISILGASGAERLIERSLGFYYLDLPFVLEASDWWQNTADEITGMTFASTVSVASSGVIYLFKRPKLATNTANWDLVKTVDVSSQNLNTNPVDFDGLNGDVDEQYRLEFVGNASASASLRLYLKGGLSFDMTETNYDTEYIYNGGSLACAYTNTAPPLCSTLSTTEGYAYTDLFVKSGTYRSIRTQSGVISTLYQLDASSWWRDDTNNVTGIRVYDPGGAETFTGQLRLYKRKKLASRVHEKLKYDVDFSGDFRSGSGSGQTFNIDGDKMYRIVCSGFAG
jgi:hypothetical protein